MSGPETYYVIRYSRKGERVACGTAKTKGLVPLMLVAEQFGGGVLMPKYNWGTKEWAVTDSEGNLFVTHNSF